MYTDTTLKLIDEIKEASEIPGSPGHNHFRLLQLVDELKLSIETPTETILRLIYQPPENAALRTVIDLDIFPLLVNSGEESSVSATEISKKTGADRGLIVRLMRVMVSLGLCASPTSEIYRATDKTATLIHPIGRDGVPCMFVILRAWSLCLEISYTDPSSYDLTLPTLTKLPEYLKVHGYKNPQDYSSSPMKWAVGQSQFEWLAARKHHQQLFNSYMSSRREGRPNWFSIYPIERLITGALQGSDAVFLVDIGGNQGHDLLRFRSENPNHPGRLILQDLYKIISNLESSVIEKFPYSFLDPQPIKNARAYFFRAIFHDWPDQICQKILLNTVSAMNQEYSRIIIVDFNPPDAVCNGYPDDEYRRRVERSKKQWIDLLAGAGLKLTGIWNMNPNMESIIEAVPVATRELQDSTTTM
ncbi:hypothetical protein N7450_006440 [Penicillium hetheringtonii]|uniref:O-methyltransferase domain-containing protein n=1 Tax=Penicillium hetheringtonii TaxID=911720 RepID=A0AAD6DKF0_9EURO|nr:hypothetical protein N7450_006440 [Penicillium hetheringtonii]